MNREDQKDSLNLGGDRRLNLEYPRVMGIVNVTPDSFSDGGRFLAAESAIAHALELVQQGADLIDVGGESTRPGAEAVAAAEELRRVVPVVEALAARDIRVSVDTSKPEVMAAVADAGAVMINDVRALIEPGALEVAAGTGLAVCLMHMQGEPRTMQARPAYRNVVEEVLEFLAYRARECESAGIARDRIVLDPGFGFGKTLEHNLQLLGQLERFSELGYPLLVGLSRKSMFGGLLDREVDERLPASLAAAALSAWLGANIIRAHDVAETCDAVSVIAAAKAARSPGA